MTISPKFTPNEYVRLGLILQPVADQTKWAFKTRTLQNKVEYLVICEFMQTFNFNRFDFKDLKREYRVTFKLSLGMAIYNYLINEVHFDYLMIEERIILTKLHKQLIELGIHENHIGHRGT